MSILIVQPSKCKTLFVDIGDLDPDVVSKALRSNNFDGYPVGVVKVKRLEPKLRRAVLQDWATFLHNMSWDSLRPELSAIENELAADLEIRL